MLAFFLPFSHSLSVSVGNSLSVRMTEIGQYCRLVGLNYTNISFCPLKISESRPTGITSTLTCGAVLEINRACKRFKEHHLSFPTWLIPHSHYSRECASVRIDAHSRIRTIHTTATMRSEAHSMSKRSEAKRSEANSRIRLLYPNSRIRFASLRYLALV